MQKSGAIFIILILLFGFSSCSKSKSNNNAAIAYLLTQSSSTTDYCTGAEITLTSTAQAMTFQLQNSQYTGYAYFTASAGQTITFTSSATSLKNFLGLRSSDSLYKGEECKILSAKSSSSFASSSDFTQTTYTATKVVYTVNTAGSYTVLLYSSTQPPSNDIQASIQ